jgi:MscS family membrane protein
MNNRLISILFLLVIFFSNTAVANENQCKNPRMAISTFLDNLQLNHWKPTIAASCISKDELIAIKLKKILDTKRIFIDYEKIPTDENFINEKQLSRFSIDERIPEIIFQKNKDEWQLTERSKQFVINEYSATFSTHVLMIIDSLPPVFFKRIMGFELWQYLLLMSMLFFSWLIGRIVDKLISGQLIKYLRSRKVSFDPLKIIILRTPIVWITISLVFMAGLPDLQLPIKPSQFLHFAVNFILSFAVVLLFSRIIDLTCDFFINRASKTNSKLDDQIVPLARRAGKTLVWLLGTIFILQNIGIEVTALVAFGSVGGVAVALASKDTVENLFGSLIVFIDQPFQIGDWVNIDGSIEGVVEEVGFRSTLIRSFEGSMISVPNAKIAHCAVNNYNKRERRRFKTTLSLRYDTPRYKIEQYLAKVREYLSNNPNVYQDGVFVYLNSMSTSSLDIMVYTFFEVPGWREELVAKEDCFLTFMKLAEELEIGFAFPTTTIELEQKSLN